MSAAPDTSVTERVARAIYLASTPPGARWDCVEEHMKEAVWRPRARAAISSMPALEEENARLREALGTLLDNLEHAFPALSHLGPIANARAALTSTREGLSTGAWEDRCRDCDDTGITIQTERRCACQGLSTGGEK